MTKLIYSMTEISSLVDQKSVLWFYSVFYTL